MLIEEEIKEGLEKYEILLIKAQDQRINLIPLTIGEISRDFPEADLLNKAVDCLMEDIVEEVDEDLVEAMLDEHRGEFKEAMQQVFEDFTTGYVAAKDEFQRELDSIEIKTIGLKEEDREEEDFACYINDIEILYICVDNDKIEPFKMKLKDIATCNNEDDLIEIIKEHYKCNYEGTDKKNLSSNVEFINDILGEYDDEIEEGAKGVIWNVYQDAFAYGYVTSESMFLKNLKEIEIKKD